MTSRIFSARSLTNLKGVHPFICLLAARALQTSEHDFAVICGLRTVEEQRVLVRTGKSQTMNSAHLTGYAIDFVPYVNGKIDWSDHEAFAAVGRAFLNAADEHDTPLRWGGDWDRDGEWKDETFFDGGHVELLRETFDWKVSHPVTPRDQWPDDVAALLRLDDPIASPIKFGPDANPLKKAHGPHCFAPRRDAAA